jgi:hypothetical protein
MEGVDVGVFPTATTRVEKPVFTLFFAAREKLLS